MVRDPVVKPFFCQCVPRPGFLFDFRAAPHQPHAFPPPKPVGPSAIVTGGTHTGGKFWVAPGGVLATPFMTSSKGFPLARWLGGGGHTRPCIWFAA